MIKIEPCRVSKEDRRHAILFEPTDTPHEIGMLTGDPAGPYVPNDDATLLILGSVESAEVLAEQIRRAIEDMRGANELAHRQPGAVQTTQPKE